MDENKGGLTGVIVEPTIVLWTTFFGLAVANAMRIVGHRFGLISLIAALLATVAINLVAIAAKKLASRTAFYAGTCGILLGFMATAPIYAHDPEHRLSSAGYERALVRGSARVGVGLVLGGAMGIALSQVLSRRHRLKN